MITDPVVAERITNESAWIEPLYLGLDPASHAFGWAVIRGNNIHDMGVWVLEGSTLIARLGSLREQWGDWLWTKGYGDWIYAVGMEAQYIGENPQSAMDICYSAGAMLGHLGDLPRLQMEGEYPQRVRMYEAMVWRKSFGMQHLRRESAKFQSIANVRHLIADTHYEYIGTPLDSIPLLLQDNATDAALIGVHGRNAIRREALNVQRAHDKAKKRKKK